MSNFQYSSSFAKPKTVISSSNEQWWTNAMSRKENKKVPTSLYTKKLSFRLLEESFFNLLR